MSMAATKRKKSTIWQHFTDGDSPRKIKCIHCNKSCSSNGSTGNLIRHMKMKHPKILLHSESYIAVNAISKDDRRNCEETVHAILEIQTENSSDNGKSVNVVDVIEEPEPQAQPMAYYLMEHMDVNRGKEIEKQLLRIIIKELHPFNIVEDKEFISFVSMLNPNYALPSHKYLSHDMLQQSYQSAVQELKSTLKGITSVALTTDTWTSINKENFIAVTVHYLNEDIELKASLLDCIFLQKNSSSSTAVFLQELVANWGLTNKIVAVVTENSPSTVEAIKECQWQHISCFAHTLNSIVKAGLAEIDDVLTKVRNIVDYFKRNSAAFYKFCEFQNEMGLTDLKLKKDTPARWNTTFDMITRLLKNKKPLLSATQSLDEESIEFSSRDWKVLENAVKLLVAFNTITVEICSEKTVPLSKVPHMARFMTKHVTNIMEQQDLPPEVKKMGNTLNKQLTKQYKNLEANDVISQSIILDPRFKKRGFSGSSFENAYSSLHKAVVSLKSEKMNEEISAQSGTQGNAKQPEFVIDMWSEFRENERPPQQNLTPAATVEIDAFLNETYMNMKDNPLTYWTNKVNQKKFPTLYELVKRRLCVPATSVPCHNIFSKAGNILVEKRSFITSGKLKELLFLNQNL